MNNKTEAISYPYFSYWLSYWFKSPSPSREHRKGEDRQAWCGGFLDRPCIQAVGSFVSSPPCCSPWGDYLGPPWTWLMTLSCPGLLMDPVLLNTLPWCCRAVPSLGRAMPCCTHSSSSSADPWALAAPWHAQIKSLQHAWNLVYCEGAAEVSILMNGGTRVIYFNWLLNRD